MKIGILTYHRSHNYGAMLQAYALRTYLIDQGYSTEFIDYWPTYRKGSYSKQKKSIFRKITGLRRDILSFWSKRRKHELFHNFLINELNVKNSMPIRYGRDIADDYDIILSGSDQIWRRFNLQEIQGIDKVYWGAYPEKSKAKKIAYAASMGHLDSNKFDSNQVRSVLSNFNAISVREQIIKDFIQPFCSADIPCVLDPVFLLDKSTWKNLFPKRGNNNKYLLFYNLLNQKEYYDEVKDLAKSRNLEIIEIRGDVSTFNFSKGLKQVLGPKEFLSLVYHAEFVVSKSFHGVAFAILFEKQFLALGMGNNAERVKSLLNALDIRGRYTTSDINIKDYIDYRDVNNKLNALKVHSVEFLKNALTT